MDYIKEFNRELHLNFNEILDAMADELLISDGQGRVIKVNSSFESLYDLKAEEAIGKTVFQLEEEGYFKPSIISKVLSQGEKMTMDQKNQFNRDIVVTATPIFDDEGKIKFVVSFSRDITEMVELQRKYSRLQTRVKKYSEEIAALRKDSRTRDFVVAASPQMKNIMDTIDKIAAVDVNVLLLGASGTGKTMLAKIIHDKSSRSEGPFVDINCAAIPENLLESELFGYEKGAFTGAAEVGKKGLVEMADGGTLFLDEISEIPVTLQAKLLKAIQEKEIIKVGGTTPVKVDFRLVTASNRDLEHCAEEGRFRKDLYYRLNVVKIDIPPLVERREDIIPLINLFTEWFNSSYNMNKEFDPGAKKVLIQYSWPGNVRELSNVIERTMVTASGDVITEGDLPGEIAGGTGNSSYSVNDVDDLERAVEELEGAIITGAYKKHGTTTGVAKALNISQPTAYRKISKYVKRTNPDKR